MKRYLAMFSASLLLGVSIKSSAQDIHFSQFYDNAILRNPALTGIFSDEYKFGLDYRQQWASVAVPYTTTMVSGETRILINREVGDYLSFGLAATFDKAGSINFTSTQVYPAIAYNKALEDEHNTYLSVGLTGGYLSRSVDQSKMTLTNQYVNGNFDMNNPTGETSSFKNLSNFDVGAGVSLNSSLDINSTLNYYLGASAYHINSPAEVFSGGYTVKLPMKFQFSGGFHCPLAEKFSFTVHANVSVQQPHSEKLIGCLFTYKSWPQGLPSIFSLSAGAFYRFNDAIIPTIKIDYKNLSIGYSYDINNSSLALGASGATATEITLYVRGKYEHRQDARDPIMCPRFAEPVNNYR
ncbi:MAG: type secretion system rane protein PorP/SprF [Flavipsychrobacter sp.]|nr:type secretion system rane protein PorP/SprF [Flavipsychrobacter sp.]